MSVYLHDFVFLPACVEEGIIDTERRTCFNSVYPCRIFPQKGMGRLKFGGMTILYGGNGSGKSTALNIMAARLGLLRDVPFQPTEFFDRYVDQVNFNIEEPAAIPAESRIICSEDVFDKTLAIRARNHDINRLRDKVAEEWFSVRYHGAGQRRLTALDGPEYAKYKRTRQMLKRSMSETIRAEVGLNVITGSNGENSFSFFWEKIRPGALYLLDEPEDSLSATWQVKLASYLEGMARFEGCQFVIATHSPFLLGIRGAKIYDLDTDGVPVRKWTELENVRQYYEFFRERMEEFS